MHTQMRSVVLVLGVAFLAALPAQATVITYDIANVVGDTYEYTYVVENDTLPVTIEEFAVYFDDALFENLRLPAAPADWDPIVIQPDVGLGDDGFYDALALLGGIPMAASLGGFIVLADFLGAGTPGSQAFDILDPFTFDVLDSGFTVRAGGLVSEPATLIMLAVGLIALSVGRRRGASHC